MVTLVYRRGFSRRRGALGLNVINSIKNSVVFQVGTSGTTGSQIIAKAVNTPSSTVTNDVSHGCVIKAIYCILDGCGLGGSGVLNVMNMYIIKNPGANLAVPDPASVGSSNEKKFIIKEFQFMVMRSQEGNTSSLLKTIL